LLDEEVFERADTRCRGGLVSIRDRVVWMVVVVLAHARSRRRQSRRFRSLLSCVEPTLIAPRPASARRRRRRSGPPTPPPTRPSTRGGRDTAPAPAGRTGGPPASRDW